MDFKGFTILTPKEYFSDLQESIRSHETSIHPDVVLVFEGGKYLGAFLSLEEAQAFVDKLLKFRNENSKGNSPYIEYRKSLKGEDLERINQANKVLNQIKWGKNGQDPADDLLPS